MTLLDLHPIQRIAIAQAAGGLISGTLGDWPYLRSALKKLELPSHKDLPFTEVKNLCTLIVKEN